MTDVQYLIDRQLGIGGQFNCDNILRRLVVRSDECYYGLQSGYVDPGFEQDPPIFACKFAEASGYEHILALANEDGRVAIQDTSKVGGAMEGFQCHNNAVFDLAWLPGEMKFVTVSGDHTAALWDVGGGDVRRVSVLAGHARSVKCVTAARAVAGPLLATGARDGHVLLWDLRTAAPQACLAPDARLPRPHAALPRTPPRRAPPRAASVTALVLRDAACLLSAGESDPNIKLWDLRRHYSAHARSPLPARALPYAGGSARLGYTTLLLDGPAARLYAACMDGVLYCFNLQARHALPERRYAGHLCGSFYVRAALAPAGDYLVSGSSDRHAYVWSTRRGRPLLRLAGHRAEVTCAAWRPDAAAPPAVLVTCGDDARSLLWRVGPEDPPDDVVGRTESPPRPAVPEPTPPSPPPARAPRAKRCLNELMVLSPSPAPPAKRARPAPAPTTPPRKRRTTSTDENSPPKRFRSEENWGAVPTPGCSFKTPTKRSPSSAAEGSPRKLRIVAFRTPTKELPDWVRDGAAPHLRLMSPQRPRAAAPDWLTRLARERRAALAVPCPALQSPAATDAASPAATAATPPPAPTPPPPARRNSTTDKTPKSGKKPKTLLKYFSVVPKTIPE